jgi:hypothetical protein
MADLRSRNLKKALAGAGYFEFGVVERNPWSGSSTLTGSRVSHEFCGIAPTENHMPTTLFTWGYWGWGAVPERAVEAFDAVERARGFAPPLFVDIRMSRSSRARGFTGRAFANAVGQHRYEWMRGLGNRAYRDAHGAIEIAEPRAAGELFELAQRAAQAQRRVIFFCACKHPREAGRTSCHRDAVTDLVLDHARDCGEDATVVEWPGGTAITFELSVSERCLRNALRGRATLPVDGEFAHGPDLAYFAGLPHCSIAELRVHQASERPVRALVGPAVYQKKWVLPIERRPVREDDEAAPLFEVSSELRRLRGLDARASA